MSSARVIASVPPSQNTTDPQKNRASGPSRNSTSAAISSGFPRRPIGTVNPSMSGPTSGSSSPSCSSGVCVAPGATALSRMFAPAHSAVGAWRRTQRASASLVTGYVLSDSPSPASARAAASSPARHASTRASGIPGCVVVAFELIATAAGSVPAASTARSPASSSTVPK